MWIFALLLPKGDWGTQRLRNLSQVMQTVSASVSLWADWLPNDAAATRLLISLMWIKTERPNWDASSVHRSALVGVEELFFFKKFYLFLFALGLLCCMWAFSSCGEWVPLFSCSVKVSHCGGISCWGARTLECGLSSWAHGLSGNRPGLGIEPCPLNWQVDS